MALEISVDGDAVAAPAGQNLLQTCLAAGKDIPYFCWHPSLGAVGACRQCAVKVFAGPGDAEGKIVMACMTPPAAGMRVSIADGEASAFRESVVEFVLKNHPHDCPVCEVGGECHLQDMTAMTGHHKRRTDLPKRTHNSQDLGPFIRHEMNRCIGCYRCVRFYKDYAGGTDFGVFGSAANVFFGRPEDGTLENPFAGNLVEVCPTGVFVDKPFSQNFRRKWDMRSTPSVCPHCAVGCNVVLHERGGEVRRAVNRHNAAINGFFLCDRGRFGVGFLESGSRLRVSHDRYGKVFSHEAAVGQLARVLQQGPLGVGSPRASMEANFVLRRLVGVKNFYAGVARHEADVMAAALAALKAVPAASLAQAEQADVVLVLGQDPLLAAPRLALALRQAALRPPADVLDARGIPAWDDAAARHAMQGKNPFMIVSPAPTGLDDVASTVLKMPADEVVAFALDVAAGAADGIAGRATRKLRAAARPLVVAGGGAAMLLAGAAIVQALVREGVGAAFCGMVPAANSIGLGCMAAPAFAACPAGAPVIVLEADVLAGEVAPALGQAAGLTCLDHVETATARGADLAIAVGSFADMDGTFVNMEGRVQRFYKAVFGEAVAPPAWMVLRDAGIAAGLLPAGLWPSQAALLADIATELPGLELPAPGPQKPPSLPHRASGRTAARAHVDVREQAPPEAADSPFSPTMEGAVQTGAAPLVWAPGWNSGQAVLRLPDEPPGVFLFAGGAALPAMPAKPWSFEDATGAEALSDLSPAIIARRQA
jgi:NADH-quinone oxidoreductase subunit G